MSGPGAIKRTLKRCGDIAFSLVCLLFFAPVIMAIAIVIRIETGQAPITAIASVGRDGVRFERYEFRRTAPVLKATGRRRGIGLTALFARLGLTGFPQLINILLGEMSFVGPIPCRYEDLRRLTDRDARFEQRFRVRPGLVGPAKTDGMLCQSHELRNLHAQLPYDLEYASSWTLLGDVKIVSGAIAALFR